MYCVFPWWCIFGWQSSWKNSFTPFACDNDCYKATIQAYIPGHATRIKLKISRHHSLGGGSSACCWFIECGSISKESPISECSAAGREWTGWFGVHAHYIALGMPMPRHSVFVLRCACMWARMVLRPYRVHYATMPCQIWISAFCNGVLWAHASS